MEFLLFIASVFCIPKTKKSRKTEESIRKTEESIPKTEESIPKTEDVEKKTHAREYPVPVMLKRLVTLIEAKGLECEGIYRKGGVSTKASFILDNPHLDFEKSLVSIHTVATATKKYLATIFRKWKQHELSELMSISTTHPESNSQLREFLRKLDPEFYSVLRFVINHLKKVTDYKTSNQMDAYNLAVCCWPTLFPVLDLSQAKDCIDLITNMINSCSYLFPCEWQVFAESTQPPCEISVERVELDSSVERVELESSV